MLSDPFFANLRDFEMKPGKSLARSFHHNCDWPLQAATMLSLAIRFDASRAQLFFHASPCRVPQHLRKPSLILRFLLCAKPKEQALLCSLGDFGRILELAT